MTTSPQRQAPCPAVPEPPTARRASSASRPSPTLLLLIFIGFISLGLPDGLLGVAWPSIRQTFDVPLDALGALLLATIAGYLTASLGSGWVIRRLGVGLLLALSSLATAVGLLGYAAAPAWLVVVALGVVAGLGAGAIDAGLNTYVALLHSPRLLNWLHAFFGVGAATGPVIMLAVLEAGQPWRLGYAIVGGGQLALGLCFLLTRRRWEVGDRGHRPPLRRGEGEAGPHPPVPAPAREGGGGRFDVLRWPAAIWLSIGLFLVYCGVEVTAGQWAYTLFVEGRAVAPQAAGLAVSAYWGALAAGRVLAGLIASRLDPATMVRASAAGLLAGALLLWLDLAAALSFVGLGLMGLAAAPIFPSLIGVTPLRFGAERAATVIGFQVAAASLGVAGLPALAGALAARLGLEAIAGLLVVATVGLVLLHEVVLWSADRHLKFQVSGCTFQVGGRHSR